jgi:hypothetical protein
MAERVALNWPTKANRAKLSANWRRMGREWATFGEQERSEWCHAWADFWSQSWLKACYWSDYPMPSNTPPPLKREDNHAG